MRNILFYKYVEIADPEGLKASQRALLEELDMKGTILLAHEGINGCVTGSDEAIAAYKSALRSDERFSDLEFKEGVTSEHGFKKIKVKVKPEIVASKTTVTLANKAPYIEPSELKALLDAGEDVVLLDARNNYESALGRFKGAVTPDITVFRDFTHVADELAALKDKPVVTYCTGGIRCEKASAVLKERGFTNVRQLHGGIIRYGEETKGAHWEGTCFVFDTRRAVFVGDAQPVAQCTGCGKVTQGYYNCAVKTCDAWYLACAQCKEALKHCCSQACREKLLETPLLFQ
jgi:UPF0176 protein